MGPVVSIPAANSMLHTGADAVPESVMFLVSSWTGARWTTPFGRFFSRLVKSTQSWASRLSLRSGTSTPSGSPDGTPLFPMPLPFADVLKTEKVEGQKSFEARRRKRRRGARQLANLMIGLHNFYELGCPRGGRLLVFDGELTSAQADTAQRYLKEAERFCAGTGGGIASTGRGKQRLFEMIQTVASTYGHSHRMEKCCKTVTVAQQVVPDCVSLPAKAGLLRGSTLMCKERERKSSKT